MTLIIPATASHCDVVMFLSMFLLFFSILASGLFFLSFVFSIRTYNGNHNLELLVSRVFSYGFSFILISFLLYVWLAIQSDFSIRYIAEHSNKDLPIFYKIS